MPKRLSMALDAVRNVPKQPPLPDHSKRPLMRPKGYLLPYTHPFANDEWSVVRRLGTCQNVIADACQEQDPASPVGSAKLLEAMKVLAKQAHKIVHVGGDAMKYWIENLRAELYSRDALAEATSEIDVLRQWGKVLPTSAVFAGLYGEKGANPIVRPVENYLYTKGRALRERATKTAETRRAAWEAKHGEAMRAHEALRGEWEAFAQQRASAVVEYRQTVLKDLPVAQPSYEFESIDKAPSPTCTSIVEAAQRERFAMRERQAQVDEERKRYETESANVPPFKVQILLRNAWAAGDELAACLRRELRAREKAVGALRARRVEHARQRTRVIWEHGTMGVLLRDAREAASTSIANTMHSWREKCERRAGRVEPPPAWIEPAWVAKVESKRTACAAVREALEARGMRLSADEKVHETAISDFRAMLVAHERAFATLPHPEQEPNSDDDDVPVCTGVVTRAERDAKGWAQAEVVDA